MKGCCAVFRLTVGSDRVFYRAEVESSPLGFGTASVIKLRCSDTHKRSRNSDVVAEVGVRSSGRARLACHLWANVWLLQRPGTA